MLDVLLSSLLLVGIPSLPAMESQGPLRVGRAVEVTIETPHPYRATQLLVAHRTLIASREIHRPGATFLTPHFARFELADGDELVVRSAAGRRSRRLVGFGKGDLGRSEGFWGPRIPGDRLFLDLYAGTEDTAGQTTRPWGYRIDRVAEGFAAPMPRAVCGADDRENARCYETSHAAIYGASRAVARLFIEGTALCTGWLVGSEGHLLTNNHCIATQTAASNTEVEFLAEGACGEDCGILDCDGVVAATGGTLVATSADLDYTLLDLFTGLDADPAGTYGYLQFRAAGPVAGETIFIPQHAGGRGKELAIFSTDPHDASGLAEIDEIVEFLSGNGATYFADTESGSSGSPVLATSDGCVVALHRGAFGCGSLGNNGAVSYEIIADLGANLPADAVVSSGVCVEGLDLIFEDGFESGATTVWSDAVP